MSTKETYARAIIWEPDVITGTTTGAWVSVKSDLFYVKGYLRKMFKIINDGGGGNGLRYRILGGRTHTANVIDDPKLIIPETAVPDGVDPEIETIFDPYKFLDFQVRDQTDGSHTTYTLEAEAYSL